MSGRSGPRLVGWLDRSSAGNDCVEYGGAHDGESAYPDEGTETDMLDGLALSYRGLPYVADTGDGSPGVLLLSNNGEDSSTYAGCALHLAQDADPMVGCAVGPMQPDSVLFLVVQRCTPSPYPKYESFVGLGVGGEGYEAFFNGTYLPFVEAPSPDVSELQAMFRFGGHGGGYGGGPGYAVTLGDGVNYGWGIILEDATTPGIGLGSVILNDTDKHLLTIVVTNNNEVTLRTDGNEEVLTPNDSTGQGAPFLGGDTIGFSTIEDTHGGGLADDERDAAYLKAAIAYVGEMTIPEIEDVESYLRSRWGTV